MPIHKPDPLGIDWDKDRPAPRAIPRPELRSLVEFQSTQQPEGAAANSPSEVIPHHFTKREPDALVLVIRRMTCIQCNSVSEAQENHLFIRTKSTFSATLQDIELFDHLPRETKVLHLPSPRCSKCF